MKNNIKAFILHIIITSVCFVFLIGFLATGPTLGKYTTNIFSRLILTIVFIMLYLYAGTLLDIKGKKKYDFFAGIIIAIVGIGLWVYTFSITGRDLFKTSEELGEYWILFNVYYTPFTIIYFLLNIAASPILLLLTNLFPSLILGCGITCKRIKLNRK